MAESTERWTRSGICPNHDVSDHGRVRRATPGKSTRIGKILSVSIDSGGYLTIGTTGGPRRVHVLVAEAFLGPIPDGGEVHHRDGNRANAHLSNLAVKPSRLAHREEHRALGSRRRRHGEPNPVVECACGCGTSFLRYDGSGRPRHWVKGHQFRMATRARRALRG